MTAQTKNIKRAQHGTNGPHVQEFRLPVNGGARIFAGSIVALDSSGNAIPGTTVAGGAVRTMGAAQEEADNTAGADAATYVRVRRGAFAFGNSSAGDLIGAAEVGANVYLVDDQTVAKTDGGAGARIVAGKCVGFDGTKVLVEVGI